MATSRLEFDGYREDFTAALRLGLEVDQKKFTPALQRTRAELGQILALLQPDELLDDGTAFFNTKIPSLLDKIDECASRWLWGEFMLDDEELRVVCGDICMLLDAVAVNIGWDSDELLEDSEATEQRRAYKQRLRHQVNELLKAIDNMLLGADAPSES